MLGSQSNGLALGYPSPSSEDIRLYFSLSGSRAHLFNYVSWLTACLGPFVTSVLLRFGNERFVVQTMAFFGAVSWSLLAAASPEDPIYGLVHRVSIGVVVGTLDFVIPNYLVGLAPPEGRWVFGLLHHLGINVGIFAVNLAGLFLNWWQLSLCAIPSFALLLAAANWLPDPPTANSTYSARSVGSDLGCIGRCLLLIAIQKFSGYNLVVSHLRIFSGGQASAVVCSLMLSAGLVATIMVRGLNRLITWSLSSFGSAAALFVVGWNMKHGQSQWIAEMAIAAFFFAFAFGLLVIPSQVQTECFRDGRTNFGSQAVLAMSKSVLVFLVLFGYPGITQKVGTDDLVTAFALLVLLGGVCGCYLFYKGHQIDDCDHDLEPLIEPE
jgi:hypothetical protein